MYLVLNGAASQNIAFDNGIGELILGTPASFTGKIAPAQQAGDQILLENIASTFTSETYKGGTTGGTLTLTGATGSMSLAFVGDYNLSSFTVTAGPQQISTDPPSTLITVGAPVCVVTGTLIRTVSGDVAVENLRIGDQVVTAAGAERPVRWIGRQTLDCRACVNTCEVMPICIAKDAFGTGLPNRELHVSPGHALCVPFLGEILIPASSLVNGATIAQRAVDVVTYWHVELDGHDILITNGMGTESYIDCGNREFLKERGRVPDPPRPLATLADYCRPFHATGPVVAAVRARLWSRAVSLGWRIDPPGVDRRSTSRGERHDLGRAA